jgi:hypothetical protein
VENLKARLKLKRLIHPEGMGNIFKVLIQHRGIASPRLTGLKQGTLGFRPHFRVGSSKPDEQIKWQRANGKFQVAFHLPFAL